MLGLLLFTLFSFRNSLINSYNRLAPFYSFSAKCIYGSSLSRISTHLISSLPKEGKLLLVGGGDGKILPHLFRHSPHFHVYYLEASSKMIKLAKGINPFKKIQFILSDQIPEGEFELVLLPFVLDSMKPKVLSDFAQAVYHSTKNGGLLLISDFYKARSLKHKLQLKLNILFFRMVVNHPNKILYDVFIPWGPLGFKLLKTKTISHEFLRSDLYIKP